LADRIQLEAQDRGVSMNGLIAQVLDKQIGQLKVTS
jgi:predicted HicB family RNase H-like nuclease